MERVAVVTGGNKGIGFGIVKGLCQRFDGTVYLTARDVGRGLAAVAELEAIGLTPKFHQLDVEVDTSVEAFSNHLKETYGRLDVLVNNAGIIFKEDSTVPFAVQAEETVRVNYFGMVRVCKFLYPLLRPHARVVHLSSSVGHLLNITNAELRAQLSDPELTEGRLNKIMQDYISAAKNGTHLELGWHRHPYFCSKVGIAALTRVHQKQFDADPRGDIVVNAVHPGYVATDMNNHEGKLTLEYGAQAPVYLALLPENTDIRGKYVWHDKTLIDWVNGPKPQYFLHD